MAKQTLCSTTGHLIIPVVVVSEQKQTTGGSTHTNVTALVCTRCGEEVSRVK